MPPAAKGKVIDSFTHKGDVYKRDQCVLVQPSEPDGEPYVGKIKEIKQIAGNSIIVSVAWFYRPEDSVGGRKQFHGEKELFASDHMDDILKDTIISKCHVHKLRKYQELSVITNEDFFTRFTYHPAAKTFEPDKVPVFCTCESPYNPDYFMVMCDECQEWFHPRCLNMTDEQAKNLPAFVCSQCRSARGDGAAVQASFANSAYP